MTKNIRNKFPV